MYCMFVFLLEASRSLGISMRQNEQICSFMVFHYCIWVLLAGSSGLLYLCPGFLWVREVQKKPEAEEQFSALSPSLVLQHNHTYVLTNTFTHTSSELLCILAAGPPLWNTVKSFPDFFLLSERCIVFKTASDLRTWWEPGKTTGLISSSFTQQQKYEDPSDSGTITEFKCMSSTSSVSWSGKKWICN